MTQETKFTPAPWRVVEESEVVSDGAKNSFWTNNVGDPACICHLWYNNENDNAVNLDNYRANAYLIAAAPEMYEALKDLCDAIQEGDIQTISDRAINGIEILKKARGEL